MTLVTPPTEDRISLWKEGINLFQLHWKPWLSLAIPFFGGFLITSVMQSTSLHDSFATFQHLQGKIDDATRQRVLNSLNWQGMLLYGLIMMTVSLLQPYLYIVYFSGKISLSKQGGHPTVGGFFFTYWKVLQVFFLVMACVIPIAMVAGIFAAVTKTGENGVFGLLAVFLFPAVLFIFLRYHFTATLAANGIKSALKTSARLMEGNYLRIIGNGAMIMIVTLIPSFLISVVVGFVGTLLFGTTDATGPVPMPLALINGTIAAATQVIIGGISSAYGVVCVSILNREKKNQPTPAAA